MITMRLRHSIAAAIAVVGVLALPRTSDAATVVTLCGWDDQPGPGVNLTAALGVDASGALLPGLPEQIRFNCGSSATIRITHRHEIHQNFDIDGAGRVTLDAEGRTGFFRLHDPTKRFTLSGLTLRGAAGDPSNFGFVRADTSPDPAGEPSPSIELIDCTIDNNTHGIDAPHGSVLARRTRFLANTTFAIIAAPIVRLESTSFVGNQATPVFSWGGSVTIDGSLFSTSRQMMLGYCALRVTNGQFLNNAGGALWLSSCTAQIDKSTFEGNHGIDGGAIRMFSGNHVTLSGTRFTQNTAAGSGGAIAVLRTYGGDEQTLTIRRGIFVGNRASTGGAIDLGWSPILLGVPDATLDLVTALFDGNVAADDGGAIAGVSATTEIARGLFVNNQANAGGAISVHQRSIMVLPPDPRSIRLLELRPPPKTTIANTVFARNRAASAGSAFDGSNATFINSSIARNDGVAISLPAGSSAHLLNTLFLANAGGNCAATGGQYFDDGHNLQFPGNACGGSIPVADAALDDVFVPLPGSPAFASGDAAACLKPPINALDVFGQTRPEGKACTIGAIEGDIEQTLRRRKERPRDTIRGRDPAKR